MAKMNAEFAQLSVGDGAANKAKGKQEEEHEQEQEQGEVDLLTRVTNAAVELGKDSEDPEKAATYQLFYDLAVLEKKREEKKKNAVKVTKHSNLLELLSNTKDSDGDDIYFYFEMSDEGEYEMLSENEDDYDDGVDDEDDDDGDEETAKEYEKWILSKIESLGKAQEEFARKWEEWEPFSD